MIRFSRPGAPGFLCSRRAGALLLGLGLLWACAWAGAEGGQAEGRHPEHREARPRGVVATVHGEATQAAIRIFHDGGNAVDAAIAAALMLGVVDGQNSGIGGGCFALVRLPDGRCLALDGREKAPAAATRDMFLREGRAVPDLSRWGALAVGVPGEVAALEWLSRRHGRLPWRRLFEDAIRVAEEGYVVTGPYARRLRDEAQLVRRSPLAAAIFLRADGQPWKEGDVLRQPELADTYRRLAERGGRWFYRGEFATLVDAWMREQGGILTRADLRDYRVVPRDPIRSRYREFEVVGFPPPSSGGVHVAEILNVLDRFDFRSEGEDSPKWVHTTLEAMKLAFADRAHWLGDPDFTRVPRGLAAPGYAAELAARIRPEAVIEVPGAGVPPGAWVDTFGRHTTHLTTADDSGCWVALTATLNTTFGSKVVVPGTGVVLNNQMDDFSAQPGVPNYFGLVGAEANAVGPGKRPLSSMSPTLLLRDGRPVFSVGAAGGPTIISQSVLAIVRFADFGHRPADALAAPRFHHQWRPGEATWEDAGWGSEVARRLEEWGHHLRRVPSLGAAQAIGWVDGRLEAAADPRVEGVAGDFP